MHAQYRKLSCSKLVLSNIFRLKTAVFTYKLINKINNVPIIFINTTSTASSQHSYSTRFAKNQNFRRSKARTNYGIFTFRFALSKIWETIPNYIKQSNSISIFILNFFFLRRHKYLVSSIMQPSYSLI